MLDSDLSEGVDVTFCNTVVDQFHINALVLIPSTERTCTGAPHVNGLKSVHVDVGPLSVWRCSFSIYGSRLQCRRFTIVRVKLCLFKFSNAGTTEKLELSGFLVM